MEYQLAELNIAKFRLPQGHPVNADFIGSLDRVNAIAEAQPGFIWRLTGNGNDAMDIHAFDDPLVASNLSVWKDLQSLNSFVYGNKEHQKIMRKRRDWFDKLDFYLVLWWVPCGQRPTLEEAKVRLGKLMNHGPTKEAFNFKQAFKPVVDN